MMDRLRSKAQARTLRGEGKSIRDISTQLSLPISTIHLWVRDIALKQIQIENINKRRYIALQKGLKDSLAIRKLAKARLHDKIRDECRNIIGTLSKRDRLITCLSLYWAEGFKKDSRLGFANSDPAMIKIFLEWLIIDEKVPLEDIRLRVGVNISHQNRIDEIQDKWSQITKVPLSQFQKPFFQQSIWKKTYDNSSTYMGVLRIRVNGQGELFLKIKALIEGLKLA